MIRTIVVKRCVHVIQNKGLFFLKKPRACQKILINTWRNNNLSDLHFPPWFLLYALLWLKEDAPMLKKKYIAHRFIIEVFSFSIALRLFITKTSRNTVQSLYWTAETVLVVAVVVETVVIAAVRCSSRTSNATPTHKSAEGLPGIPCLLSQYTSGRTPPRSGIWNTVFVTCRNDGRKNSPIVNFNPPPSCFCCMKRERKSERHREDEKKKKRMRCQPLHKYYSIHHHY